MSQDKNNLIEKQENDELRNEPSSQYSRLGSSQPDYLTSTQYDDLQNSGSQRWYSQRDWYEPEDNVTASQNEGWQNSNWNSQPNSYQYSQDSFWASSQQSGIYFSNLTFFLYLYYSSDFFQIYKHKSILSFSIYI